MNSGRNHARLALLIAPAVAVFVAFFLLPLGRLAIESAEGGKGLGTYALILTNSRYFESLVSTIVLSALVTAATLAISTIAGLFLHRNRFPGRALLTATLTLPLAFPGVVIGFMVILLAGRQGLIGQVTSSLGLPKAVFAYSMGGLFMGYVYFSIPRVILTIKAAAEKLDPDLEAAARSCGAASWQVTRDVLLPALRPALISSGAICFATAMGAFGTAFTLATNIEVLPMTIYTEFTLNAQIAVAAALSLALGAVTWLILYAARSAAGTSVAASA